MCTQKHTHTQFTFISGALLDKILQVSELNVDGPAPLEEGLAANILAGDGALKAAAAAIRQPLPAVWQLQQLAKVFGDLNLVTHQH